MRSKPAVSVVMPVHNAVATVAWAIEDMLNQTYQDLEVVVVDDASTDGTADVVADYRHQRLRVVRRRKKARDLGTVLNAGLRRAVGDLIVRMDADDRCRPDRVAEQVRFLRTHPDVGIVGSWAILDDWRYGASLSRPPVDDDEIAWKLGYRNCMLHPCTTIRMSLLRKLRGYNPGAVYAEDYCLFSRAARISKLANIPEAFVTKSITPDSVSVSGHRIQSSTVTSVAIANFTYWTRRPLSPVLAHQLTMNYYQSADSKREILDAALLLCIAMADSGRVERTRATEFYESFAAKLQSAPCSSGESLDIDEHIGRARGRLG